MNDERSHGLDGYRELMLLSEIEGAEQLSQRDLAQRLGIALGLVNSYLKNLVAKGYVRVKSFPRNRYGYLLTPKGVAEKGRLALQHLNYFTSLYTSTRQEYLGLFRRLKAERIEEVHFCGVDEVAEIAYLSLLETGLQLAEVLDVSPPTRATFLGRVVRDIAAGVEPDKPLIVTSLKKRDELLALLAAAGVEPDRIHLPGEGA